MILSIFGAPVVFLKTDNIEKLFPEAVYNEIISYLTNPDNKFAELVDFLKKTTLKYAYLYSDTPATDLKFHSSWVNLTFQGCEINSHNDRSDTTEKSLIALFYPKTAKGASNLVFIHNSKGGEWASDCLEEDLVCTSIEEGDIIIFDNFMFHAVDANSSDVPRMAIAIEFKME
jgi:hypothetical protein